MSRYEVLRHFADSWGLAFLVGVFLLAVWRALRPSAASQMEEARMIPLRDEDPAQ
ncbi:cbb3-type cytochrome c oxidase subunit 3 [Sphingomonas psychrotolerans]|uniref:CcoQ/FixQ family Cbb3-type cytochrome c oxidase assembly chaperone n=1 Tax=Sphingomonas psychrotolerans TaxID=1327635 RepID=A0A2K8MI41_9SPHN|nr:cbb3-type cytochrome c oxidase subunit 3 [Sphingomonas psychrotolerans]ATY33558.1 CcoQ/FixQ family Cbb3-type cytochrome c oxidase assembly chaperone [Sphingomonas psychrotolerans]